MHTPLSTAISISHLVQLLPHQMPAKRSVRACDAILPSRHQCCHRCVGWSTLEITEITLFASLFFSTSGWELARTIYSQATYNGVSIPPSGREELPPTFGAIDFPRSLVPSHFVSAIEPLRWHRCSSVAQLQHEKASLGRGGHAVTHFLYCAPRLDLNLGVYHLCQGGATSSINKSSQLTAQVTTNATR